MQCGSYKKVDIAVANGSVGHRLSNGYVRRKIPENLQLDACEDSASGDGQCSYRCLHDAADVAGLAQVG